ncbi:hypothetical protein [Sphingopyxis indica]|uniref:Uncharacterized protein n=1 Tax=Sphingopyxis indica TaxID=436663 RepID=A0A239L6D3_9SPHN|nr:hypothetical protein [Sphingopyxis indica]SNT26147.1 hypothetical protein SAMN06295955_1205 [Sphingopyxis indica]
MRYRASQQRVADDRLQSGHSISRLDLSAMFDDPERQVMGVQIGIAAGPEGGCALLSRMLA